MASAKALAVSSSKRHPRIAVVTSPRRRRRRRHHRRIVVRAERCRIATRAERERSSPSSPRCRRSAVMPSRRPSLSPSSLPVSSSSPSSERRATPRRVVASSPSSPSSFSLFWLPTTAFRGRHQHYPSLVCRSAPLSSPAVVAVVAAAITTACSRPIRPPSSSSRRHRGHLTSWFGSCRCPQFQPCSPASVVVGSSLVGIGPRRHRRRGQSPRCRKPLPQLLPQQPDASPQQQQPCSMQPQQHQPAAPPNSAEPSSNSSGTNSSVPAAAAVAAQQPAISKAVPTTWTWFLFFVKIFCIAA